MATKPELVVTTIGLKASEVEKVGIEPLKGYASAGQVDKKADVKSAGVWLKKIDEADKGTATLYIAEEKNLEQTFIDQLDDAELSEEAFDKVYSYWVDGYKRQEVNRVARDKVMTDLNLKEPSKREQVKADAKREANLEAVKKMVETGQFTEEQAKRILGVD